MREGRAGVIGGGTMGAGIAQVAAASGFETVLCEPLAGVVALERIERGLAKTAERSGWSEDEYTAARGRLTLVETIEGLDSCGIVVEAVPEQLALKREVLGAAAAVCGDETILATNTSSIPVTAIAAGVGRPERVVGMHFFNPVPLMRVVEMIPGVKTAPDTVSMAVRFCEALGKTVIVARDGPGFLVNRCGRPFAGEGLRLLQERIAPAEQIDRICRIGGGFRMGPFELMDLVGIDVNFAVATSFSELSFGEPRWKPNPLQQRMVESGDLGRKTGRGWYSYAQNPYRPDDPSPPKPTGSGSGGVTVTGSGAVADELRARLPSAGVGEATFEIVLCASRSLAAWGRPGAVGFNLLPGSRLVELTRDERTADDAAATAVSLFSGLGYHVEWVEDAPGLVLGRIVAQLVNEACFAVGEGVGSADEVDQGTTLGLNHPRGPFEWGESIGWPAVLEMIEGLWQERREERYRPAPLLQRLAGQRRG